MSFKVMHKIDLDPAAAARHGPGSTQVVLTLPDNDLCKDGPACMGKSVL